MSPDGFFVIQISPNSITAGEFTTPSPFPTSLATMSTSGFYRWAKFGWNLRCYACCVLSLLENTRNTPQNRYVKTWRHPRNWKYITYRNASIGEPSQGHMQHAQKIRWSLAMWFSSYASGQTDRQTDRRTTKQTYSSQYFPPLQFCGAPCISHTRTVVWQCCKGDDESLWERGKFELN